MSCTVDIAHLAVIGSRDAWFTEDFVFDRLNNWMLDCPYHVAQGSALTIISGGARGPDTFAETYADTFHHTKLIFPVTSEAWAHSRAAGMNRNTYIIECADAVIVFWDGQSRGTQDSIRKAIDRRLPIWIYYLDGRCELAGYHNPTIRRTS